MKNFNYLTNFSFKLFNLNFIYKIFIDWLKLTLIFSIIFKLTSLIMKFYSNINTFDFLIILLITFNNTIGYYFFKMVFLY